MQTVTVKLTDSASQLLVAQLPTDFINAMAPPCPASQVPQLPTEGKHKPICIYIYIYNIIYISTIEIWCRCTFTRKACKELRQLQLLCWSVMVSPHLGARAEFKSDMLGSAPVCQRMPGCVTKLRMRSHESTNINHNATFCFWLVYEARTLLSQDVGSQDVAAE